MNGSRASRDVPKVTQLAGGRGHERGGSYTRGRGKWSGRTTTPTRRSLSETPPSRAAAPTCTTPASAAQVRPVLVRARTEDHRAANRLARLRGLLAQQPGGARGAVQVGVEQRLARGDAPRQLERLDPHVLEAGHGQAVVAAHRVRTWSKGGPVCGIGTSSRPCARIALMITPKAAARSRAATRWRRTGPPAAARETPRGCRDRIAAGGRAETPWPPPVEAPAVVEGQALGVLDRETE